MNSPTNNPADRTINRFGGITRCAKALAKPKSTIQRWKKSGFIHPDYYPEILAAAVVEGVTLDARDFNPVDVNHPAFNAPKTAADDSTAPRTAGSSPNPIPGTELSPQPDAGPEPVAGTAERGGTSSSSSYPHSAAPAGAERVS